MTPKGNALAAGDRTGLKTDCATTGTPDAGRGTPGAVAEAEEAEEEEGGGSERGGVTSDATVAAAGVGAAGATRASRT